MLKKFPICPACFHTLIYVTSTSNCGWSCGCGYWRKTNEPSFLKALRELPDTDKNNAPDILTEEK
jgi:hypothetical protein